MCCCLKLDDEYMLTSIIYCNSESKLYIDSINVQIEPIKNSPVFATEDSGRSEKEASSLQLSPFRDFKISPYYLYQTPISEQEM